MRGQDLLLIAVLAVTFVFGYFLVKKVDRFLEESGQEQADDETQSLCTDFSEPTTAGTAEIPKQAAGKYPGPES